MINKNAICNGIKSAIREKGLSQSEVAKRIGSTPNKLSSALNCKRELKLDTFFNLCTVLNLDPCIFYARQQTAETVNLCGRAVEEIAVTTSDGEVVSVITANKIIEHKGYRVILVES